MINESNKERDSLVFWMEYYKNQVDNKTNELTMLSNRIRDAILVSTILIGISGSFITYILTYNLNWLIYISISLVFLSFLIYIHAIIKGYEALVSISDILNSFYEAYTEFKLSDYNAWDQQHIKGVSIGKLEQSLDNYIKVLHETNGFQYTLTARMITLLIRAGIFLLLLSIVMFCFSKSYIVGSITLTLSVSTYFASRYLDKTIIKM